MPEPDFIGVGAHLSGTQWWRGLLMAHPEVDLRPVSHDGLDTFFEPFCTRAMTDDDVEAYRARFAGHAGTITGEWSDRYLYNAWMLPLLARAAPNAKILFLARDPVERFRSALAFRLGLPDADAGTIHMTEAFHRGRYASQLRTLTHFFDRERVLVQQYERCVSDPAGEYRRALEFLGVDAAVEPKALRKPPPRPNVVRFPALRRLLGRAVPEPVTLWPDLEAALVTALTDEVRELGDAVDVRLWPSFAHVVDVHG